MNENKKSKEKKSEANAVPSSIFVKGLYCIFPSTVLRPHRTVRALHDQGTYPIPTTHIPIPGDLSQIPYTLRILKSCTSLKDRASPSEYFS